MVEPNGSGGMIHYAYQMCNALASKGAEVTLITDMSYELLDYPHQFEVQNRLKLWPQHDPQTSKNVYSSNIDIIIHKILWNLRRGLRAFYLIKAWFELSNYLLGTAPDLVQFGKINFPFEAFFLKRLSNKGLVLTQICHEFERRESSGLFSREFDKLYDSVYQNFSVIFFHAKENRNRFHELYKFSEKDSYIIPLGNQNIFLGDEKEIQQIKMNFQKKYRLDGEEFKILFFGVLAPSKGVPVLINAFSKISQSFPVKLIIAGYPSKHFNISKLLNQINDLNVQDQIILDLRYIPNNEVSALFKLVDLAVYPYLSSTQSASIQVAYSVGKPVIASNVGGLPEVVEEGSTGFLVKPGDPDDLAEKLKRLLGDFELRKKMSENAKELSKTRFNWSSIADEILSIYIQKDLLED